MREDLYARLSRNWTDPDHTFIKLLDGRRITYRDVSEGSARMANALVGLGVQPGDRIAVQTDKSPESILLYLGCIRAGAVYLPLNTAYTLTEIEYFLSDAEPSLVVCRPSAHAETESLTRRLGVRNCLTLGTQGDGSIVEAAREQPVTFDDVPRQAGDLAAILYTSGTTGRSKGAMLTHDNLASNAEALVGAWKFTADDVLIHALPLFHVHGLFTATNVILRAHASMLFLPRFDADEIFSVMPHATTMMGVPTFYVRLLQDDRLSPETTRHIRLFVSGSAPLLAETHRAFTQRTGHAILERYGMTETGMNTSNPYEGERVPGAVGFPLPGTEVRIVDPESGEPLPRDGIGMIEVKGPNVFKGYWRMPEKTASEFKPDGFFITGDLGKIDKRGYVHIVGRGKDLVISGGYNVYPKEVENEIDAIPGVVESAVIGVPHADFGEGVTAVVVRAAGAALTEPQIISTVKSRLAAYKVPKRVVFVDAFPRNTMGKVQKNVLRDTYAGLFASG
ncbi:MAG: malonyl-CoA synthase [Hyphomicrobiaceae bacterium]